MKKKVLLLLIGFILAGCQVCYSVPNRMGGPAMGRPPMVHAANYGRPPMGVHRPPMHNNIPPIRPIPNRRPPLSHIGTRPLPPPPPPPVVRPYRPYYPIGLRPYFYSSVYYPSIYYSTTYYPLTDSYTTVEPVSSTVNAVVVRDNYAGINTAANILNAAANVASTIRFLTW